MISEIINKINALNDSIKREEDELKGIVFSAIDRVATMQVAKKVSKFIHIVNFSDISGKVWSADYYIWEHNAKILKAKLKDMNGLECYEYIINLPNSKTEMGNYVIKYSMDGHCGLKFQMKYPCNNEYIDKLINELNNYGRR